MFLKCSSLSSMDLSSFDTTNVTNMRCMFYGCSSLISINLSSFNTTNIIDVHWIFEGCCHLKKEDVKLNENEEKIFNELYQKNV